MRRFDRKYENNISTNFKDNQQYRSKSVKKNMGKNKTMAKEFNVVMREIWTHSCRMSKFTREENKKLQHHLLR